jgi:hypothetical protein
MVQTIQITFYDTELSVDYEYDPGEPMVMYYPDGTGSPGCAHSVEIHDIFVGETGIYNVFDDRLISDLEERILENYE